MTDVTIRFVVDWKTEHDENSDEYSDRDTFVEQLIEVLGQDLAGNGFAVTDAREVGDE